MPSRGIYKSKVLLHGKTERERIINLSKRDILKSAIDSPDYKDMVADNVHRKFMVSSTDVDNKKRIKSMPYETIKLGALIVWNEMHWLVNSVDFDDEIYQRGTIVQCNRIIRWQNSNTKKIIERWCFCSKPYTSNINEGTVVSTLNGKYDIQLPYDSESIQVGVDKRLMLDVVGGKPMVYKITFPDTNTNKYQDIDGGFIEWTVASDAYVEGKDNVELMICDYIEPEDSNPTTYPDELLKCEIIGREDIRTDGSSRVYHAKFYKSDKKTETVDGIAPLWTLNCPNRYKDCFSISLSDNDFSATLSLKNADELIGQKVSLELHDSNGLYYVSSIQIEVIV